jgi:hypothetical protein
MALISNWDWRKRVFMLTLTLALMMSVGLGMTSFKGSVSAASTHVSSVHLIRHIRAHNFLTIRVGGGSFGPLNSLYTFATEIWTDETPGGVIYGVGGFCATYNNSYADTYWMACRFLHNGSQIWNHGTDTSLISSGSPWSYGPSDFSAGSGSGRWEIDISAIDTNGGSVVSTSNVNEQDRFYVGWNLPSSFTI